MKVTFTDPKLTGRFCNVFVKNLECQSNGECSFRCVSDERTIRKWHFYIQDSRKVSAHATPLISGRRQEKEIKDVKDVLSCLNSSRNDA